MQDPNDQESTNWWNLSKEKVATRLNTDLEKGLDKAEAQNRLKQFGLNELPKEPSYSVIKILLHQFTSLIIWLLIAAIFISIILGEWIDASVIAIIVVINTILGFIQEYQAEKSLAALKKLSKPSSKVIRHDHTQSVPSNKITIGDLIVVEAGDQIPSDGRLIEAVQLSIEESALTGESVPVHKTTDIISEPNPPIGDRKNMAFMGTIVVGGKGKILITEIGKNTEIGKIAFSLQEEEEGLTLLQKRLDHLGKWLVILCLAIVSIIFILGLIKDHTLKDILMISLSLAVSAVPEGLPTIVTVALSLGVQQMVKRNALIRRLSSVETLGCITVLCTDKTGTLTQNEMTVTTIWANEEFIDVTGNGYQPEGEFKIKGEIIDPSQYLELIHILKTAALCNSANLEQKDDEWVITGDPTEGCLLTAAQKVGLDKNQLEQEFPLEREIPFSSERKMMSMLRKHQDSFILFAKGAPDIIVKQSKFFLKDNIEQELKEEQYQKIEKAQQNLSEQGLRVLSCAYKKINSPEDNEFLEKDLIFIGLIAMKDPLRPEAIEAVKTCKKAGIRTVMITGDHKDTAAAIAKELGIMQANSIAMDGQELSKISQDQLKNEVDRISVYARVAPEHKLLIIKAWKERGQVIAMTGDGVNDAPAIKGADIGISMGIRGTEVSKEASDMVILDDNFASIVSAVREGRGIYDNIIKFVTYLLASNVAEILVIISSMIIGFWNDQWRHFIPLVPVQILWINLVTDGLPAIALAMDPTDPKAMEYPPRNPSASLLTPHIILQIILISLLIASGALIACYIGLQHSIVMAQTMTFTSLVTLELVKIQIVRMPYNSSLLSNLWIVGAVCISLLAQVGVIYIPFFQPIFHTVNLGLQQWGIILLITFISAVIAIGINKITNPRQDLYKKAEI